MQNTQLTNELSYDILNNFILNATAKGIEVFNSLESLNFLLNKARACDELKKENARLNELINKEQNNGNRN